MTNPTNNGADPSNSPAREVGAQGRDCGHREVCQTGVGSEHGTDPAALSAQSRNQPDGSAISITKQKCSICGAPDHTHLHCYGTDAQRPVSSNHCSHSLIVTRTDASGTRWHCASCLRTFFPSGDTGAEQATVRLRAALVSAYGIWSQYQGEACEAANKMADTINAALSRDSSPPETKALPCRRPISNGYPCPDYPNCECARERSAEETYTNEAPSHPPILPERFNSVSLPENGLVNGTISNRGESK